MAVEILRKLRLWTKCDTWWQKAELRMFALKMNT